ncbi:MULTISPECIES: hypothetical protein [Prauserella salsuginis group]|uniref:Uncharacterized protein n=1 Tax=Prauserella salsuginis TaxID=387889 RepID=A0ABW6G6Q6_9PSEU|nr:MULTISPECIES: hypothetical protein [Prauserella salsuginis group]
MDPRDRADAVLARAQRRSGVVTPDNMQSPMDSSDTQVIPSSVVRSAAEQDPDATAKVPASVIERNDESHLSRPSPTVPLNQREAAAAAAESPAGTAGPAAGNAATQNTAPQNARPGDPAPALSENARTQPLATHGAQPVDTADAPPDMTFTGAPVTPVAPNASRTPGDGPDTADSTGEDAGSGSGDAGGGFVPTTKVEPGTGTSELARRLEGL